MYITELMFFWTFWSAFYIKLWWDNCWNVSTSYSIGMNEEDSSLNEAQQRRQTAQKSRPVHPSQGQHNKDPHIISSTHTTTRPPVSRGRAVSGHLPGNPQQPHKNSHSNRRWTTELLRDCSLTTILVNQLANTFKTQQTLVNSKACLFNMVCLVYIPWYVFFALFITYITLIWHLNGNLVDVVILFKTVQHCPACHACLGEVKIFSVYVTLDW